MDTCIKNSHTWILFLGCLLSSALLTPLAGRLATRLGAVDRGGHRKIHRRDTPLLGGLAVALPFIVICLLGVLWPALLPPSMAGARLEMALLAVGGLVVLGLGVVDDLRELGARTRLAVHVLVALTFCAGGFTLRDLDFPLVGPIHLGFPFDVVVTVLWVTGLINAFNIIDGLDGLAAGVALLSFGGLAAVGAIDHCPLVVALCVPLGAALLGFLPFNFSPARIFLGDSGSTFLGFTLAAIALLASCKTPMGQGFPASVMILGLPIFETLVSMLRRYLRGAPVFAGDDGHTHHRLLRRGFTPRHTVLLIHGATLVLVLSGILARVLPAHSSAIWIPVGLSLFVLASISWTAGYLRTPAAKTLFYRRQRNIVLSALSRYASLSLSLDSSSENLEEILRFCRPRLKLGFLEVRTVGGVVLARAGIEEAPSQNPIGELVVTSGSERRCRVRYQHENEWDREECRDVVACLASIFSRVKIHDARGVLEESGLLGGRERNGALDVGVH